MRVLVLGSTGFLGKLLARELAGAGHAVEGWARGAVDDPAAGSRRVDLLADERLPVPREPWQAAVLLAGPSVPARFAARVEGAATLWIAARALEHVARCAPGARFVVASSAHVLAPGAPGVGGAPAPLGEDADVDPRGDYGTAKAAVESLARAHAADLDVVVARLFGSLGPGLPRGLFVPDLLERLARREPVVRLAGPDAARDLTDGRDVARALRALVEAPPGAGGTFHVGTGRALRLAAVAERLARALSPGTRVEFAPGEGAAWIADPARLRAATGFEPRHDLDATIAWTARGAALAPRAGA